jgi:multiple antibiotic resistance protein
MRAGKTRLGYSHLPPLEGSVPGFEGHFNAFVTMLVTIDPLALGPLFLALTAGMNRSERGQVAIRASIIGFVVLSGFALIGAGVLSVFGITLPAFRVAGGILLFVIAFDMIFERRHQRHEKSAERAVTRDMIRDIAAFPLAIPLIAGPGAISASVLIAGSYPTWAGKAVLVGIILVCLLITWGVFLLSERIDGILGETGRSILTRLLGVILAALAVQFFADGVKALIAL